MNPEKQHADIVFYNANIYTVDDENSIQEAIAIKDGYILAVGQTEKIMPYVNEQTQVRDMAGKTVMPGLVDCHLHAFWGGSQLISCSLNYQSLTVEQTLNIIQTSLNQDPIRDDAYWLPVRAWSRSEMQPAGADMNRMILDSLETKRPVVLFSSDCHTLVANSRALALLGIDEEVENPEDGKYYRDDEGRLNGVIDDAPCMRAFDEATRLSHEQMVLLADRIQKALNQQGVTTVMDARVYTEHLDAFATLKERKQLTLRFLGAKEITPSQAKSEIEAQESVQDVVVLANKYNKEAWRPEPNVGICSVKIFIDGVLQAPMCTAYLLSPYLENTGCESEPKWTISTNKGDLYFPEAIIDILTLTCAQLQINPHFHTVGEGAIEVVLNSIEKMRKIYTDVDARPSLAHNELVAPHQFKRFADLNTTAVLSFQWAGVTNFDEQYFLGEERFQNLEPHAKFIDAGARIAFNSDWPIDALDEWGSFQIGMTRQLPYDGALKLDNDRVLTLLETLRAATINAAYTLGKERYIGSLEVGKFADLIVLDRNVFCEPTTKIGKTKVILTMVGANIVYQA